MEPMQDSQNQLFDPMCDHMNWNACNAFRSLRRYKTLLGYFYELFPFLPKLWLKTILCSQTRQIQCLIIITVNVQCLFKYMNQANDQCINAHMYLMLDSPINLPVNCIATIVTHVSLLTLNMCHTKRFSDSCEMQDASWEKWDKRW